jgi:hypothetical protein
MANLKKTFYKEQKPKRNNGRQAGRPWICKWNKNKRKQGCIQTLRSRITGVASTFCKVQNKSEHP